MGIVCTGRKNDKKKIHKLWEVPQSFNLQDYKTPEMAINPEKDIAFPKFSTVQEVSSIEEAVQCKTTPKMPINSIKWWEQGP